MSFRTILALLITILLTVAIMQNPEEGDFNLVLVKVHVPKLIVMTTMSVGGLLLGLLVSRPRKTTNDTPYPADEQGTIERRSNTLSDEDRDYISEP